MASIVACLCSRDGGFASTAGVAVIVASRCHDVAKSSQYCSWGSHGWGQESPGCSWCIGE